MNWLRALIILCLAALPSSAAFVSFQASNNNPVGCSDNVPAIAAAFGFNTCTFYDSMQSLGTVDVNQTGVAGFNWYTQDSYNIASFTGSISGTTLTVSAVQFGTLAVRQTLGSGGGGNPTAGTTITALGSGSGGTGTYTVSVSQTLASTNLSASIAQAPNTMSVSASGLTLTNVSNGATNFGISTTHLLSQTAGPPVPYHGMTFQNGGHFRAYLAYDENLGHNITGLTNARWPAWWHTNYAGLAAGARYLEIDTLDALPAGMSNPVSIDNFLHDWSGATSEDSGFSIPSRANLCNPTVDATTFHTYDMLWVPTTKNSGTGIWAFFFDIETCSGNALFTGSISGTVLTVSAVSFGTLKTGSYIGGIGVTGKTTVSSLGTGTGGTGTYNLNFSSTVSSETMFASNQNICQYFLSPGVSTCTNSTTQGVFSTPEFQGNGLNLILSSGCQNYYSTTNCNVGTSTGDWPMKIKNIQVWQTQIGDKLVQWLEERYRPANDNDVSLRNAA